jgi:Mg2+ and Co2+ transporter CorA
MLFPHNWELPESIKRRLGKTTFGKQRAIVEDGHVLLVLHKVPGPADQRREGVLFWRDPQGEWKSSAGGNGIERLKSHIESFATTAEKLEKTYATANSATDYFELLDHIVPVRRSGRNGFRAIQSAREQCKDYVDIIEVRDLASDMDRTLEILQQDTKNAIDYRTAREAEAQATFGRATARASHRLNILAALFLPLTAITGLMGMNIASGLEGFGPLAFWGVFLVGLLTGIALQSWISVSSDT